MAPPFPRLHRRSLLAAAGIAIALPRTTRAAFAIDGPARQRPLATKSVCLDLVRAGERLVAVGERGHVLLSDDRGKSWRQASAVPTRTTLTALHATDARNLWAVGHGGVILRSADGGDSWRVAHGKADGADVLLAIRVDPDGRGLAVGGFGVALATRDGGATWAGAPLLPGEAGERHLNRIVVSAQGSWLIAAEGGHVLRSSDRGASWTAVKTPYAGSLWSGLALADGTLLVCGMRGNLVTSRDDGRSWTHRAVPEAGSLTALAELPDGRAVLVGADGTLVTAAPGAQSFAFRRLDDRATLTGVVALSAREVVLASMAGVRVANLEG
jgi:photosystem II stability/assembly factor-like uncharacterized protein